MTTVTRGSCLCGEVTYELRGHIGLFQYCHCSRCRKFTGSAHASNLFVQPEQLVWLSGESLVRRFEPQTSKHFATAFCQQCGSSLPWLSKSGKAMVVPAGSLDADPGIRPLQSIHFASRAPWYVSPDALPAYDRLPTKKPDAKSKGKV
ncbi:GFA family protein [Ferrimonas gelatinilytica]|uniref:GFA family protein n=1 Tax=Ferrimonas gelatinilytica TaxID=1255257 RepID=A0ABP9SE01_9GAMM